MPYQQDTLAAQECGRTGADEIAPRVLIAEDEWAMSTGLKYLFKRHGYEVVPVDNGREAARQLLADPPFDIAILDVMMPQMDGFEVLRHVRQHDVHTPIIVLSAKGAEDDKVRGLALGADDYMTKPFSDKELVARVDAVRRRRGVTQPLPKVIRMDDVMVDFETLVARRGEATVHLTPLEWEVLRYMAHRRGKAVSRDEFKRKVLKLPEEVETRTMDRHAYALRCKIEIDPTRPRHIISVFGVGYRLEHFEILA